MPINPNFLERTAFFTLNAAPGPMLDLAGMLAYQAVSTAVQLNIFTALAERPSTTSELTQRLQANERGVRSLLKALLAIGYVVERDGRFHNSAMTQKWFVESGVLDMNATLSVWDVFIRELWPHAAEVIRTGERPFDFYDFVYKDPELAHNFQQLLVGNANVAGGDVLKRLTVPHGAARVLDVGGGHGVFSVMLANAHPQLQATILDGEVALGTAEKHVTEHHLSSRIRLLPGDLWQIDWGEPYDLILLFNLLHHYDLDTNRKLLQKVHAALKPGGQVAILDQIEGNVFGGGSNAIVQLVALMFYLFADGRVYTSEELMGLLTETGFKNQHLAKLAKAPGTSLITAVK